MLVGLIATPREEMLTNPERAKETMAKVSEAIKNLPAGVTVKGRYALGAWDNFISVTIFDVQGPEQLIPLTLVLGENMHCDGYPVIDNTEEALQQAAGVR